MKKSTFIFLISILYGSILQAQTSFMFEESAVPSQWVSSDKGTLSLSTQHFKQGSRSLCWETTGKASLTISSSSIAFTSKNGAYMQIYSPSTSNDTLVIEFLNNSSVAKTGRFLCNYSGWREFNRAYSEYASNAQVLFSSVRISIHPTNLTATRKIYFDDVDLNKTITSNRIVGSQWICDYKYFKKADTTLLSYFANTPDMAITTPAAAELTDLNTLRGLSNLTLAPRAGTVTELLAAQLFAGSLTITNNPDGSVSGKVINTSVDSLTSTKVTNYWLYAEWLAADMLANPSDQTRYNLFHNYLNHLLDQGFAEGCNFMLSTSDYTSAQTIPVSLLNVLPACTNDEKREIVKLAKWILYYGKMFNAQSSYLSDLNSDYIYLFTPYLLSVAVNQPDDAVAVRDLKAFKRFMERNTEYAPGNVDFLKPDGTGFHHNAQYNGYMYAYRTWVQNLYYLKGTQYQISEDAYARLKKAIISQYVMATLDTGNYRFYGNSLSGRNPFKTQTPFTKVLFDNLISIGSDILKSQDNELANAYNYFFQTNKYSGFTTTPYEGFYQFNYGNLGIYRKNNWVVTMKAPSLYMYTAEIYDNQNRFGRYQGHGAIEVMYANANSANNQNASGYPTSSTTGGWDWNCVPGATVVRYGDWSEMMPYRSASGRFDQYTASKNFSGSLSFGDCGIFATDFDQIDSWGDPAFTPTNLVFKKSMFAIDGYIFCLGSNISSSGSYDSGMNTTTNLFQSVIYPTSGNLIVNGVNQVSPYSFQQSSPSDNWLITPQGTGYYVPSGNNELAIQYDSQSSPVQTGADATSPATSIVAAKAYINHGVKPSSKSYEFVIVPGTTASEMQNVASEAANNNLYEVLAQNETVHSILYKPSRTTAYSFFGAYSGAELGIVLSTTSEHLLIDTYDADNNVHKMAICNPNLNPESNATFGFLPNATQTTLTLKGKWQLATADARISIVQQTDHTTEISVTMNNGEPLYFTLKDSASSSIENAVTDSSNIEIVKQEYFSLTGLLVGKSLHSLPEGIYIEKTTYKDGRFSSKKRIIKR